MGRELWGNNGHGAASPANGNTLPNGRLDNTGCTRNESPVPSNELATHGQHGREDNIPEDQSRRQQQRSNPPDRSTSTTSEMLSASVKERQNGRNSLMDDASLNNEVMDMIVKTREKTEAQLGGKPTLEPRDDSSNRLTPPAPQARQQQQQQQQAMPGAFPMGRQTSIAYSSSSMHTINTNQSSKHLDTPTLEAVRVPDSQELYDIEEEVRQRILEQAIQADVVISVDEDDGPTSTGKKAQGKRVMTLSCIALLVVLAIVGLVIGLSFQRKAGNGTESVNTDILENSTKSNPSELPLLQQIRERGYIRCGIYLDQPGFGYKDKATGEVTGFNYQLCRAVAAAVFGNGSKYELVTTNAGTRFEMLANGEIDVVSQTVSATMERDIAEKSTSKGFSFSHPFYYSGTTFGGVPEYVACADKLDPFHGTCRGLRVCVTTGTTQEYVVNDLLPGPVAVQYNEPTDAIRYMNNGTCNVIAAERHMLQPSNLKALVGLMFNITFELGNNTFSRDPISLLTLDGQPDWSQLVNSVIKILFSAEALGITQANAQSYVFGQDVPRGLQNRIRDVISAVGNYGDLFATAEGLGNAISRDGLNSLNQNLDTGLMYAQPFGDLNANAQEATQFSATMGQLQDRGYLRCGVTNLEPGFAWQDPNTLEWTGLHIEICRGLAAALFQGDATKIDFVRVEYGFQALQDRLVDTLAGETVTMANEFFEPSTGSSYSFSTPYFYESTSNASATTSPSILALATLPEDELWSSFVYWTVMALVYAEERDITSTSAIDMPTMNVFGFQYMQSFRDCISAVGNYGDVYERTLGSTLPRAGGNLLNEFPYGPQQVAFPLS